MNKKQYEELATILESKATTWCCVDITDFLGANFDNFDREKFMVACGFDRAYTHDELLTAYFNQIEKIVDSNVMIIQGN